MSPAITRLGSDVSVSGAEHAGQRAVGLVAQPGGRGPGGGAQRRGARQRPRRRGRRGRGGRRRRRLWAVRSHLAAGPDALAASGPWSTPYQELASCDPGVVAKPSVGRAVLIAQL